MFNRSRLRGQWRCRRVDQIPTAGSWSLTKTHFCLHPRLLYFGILIALSLAVFYQALIVLKQMAGSSPEYSFIPIILPVSLILIYLERAEIFSIVNIEPFVGAAIVVTAGLATLGFHTLVGSFTANERASISVFLLVSFWIAAFCFCFGSKAGWRALFPLLFLYFLVPLPEVVMSKIISALQYGSAEAAALLFNVAGVANVRDGESFLLANQRIEIARECSGIRSAIALLIAGLVFSHLLLRSRWSKILFVAAIPVLAIFKNGVRIFTLAVLGVYVDPAILGGALHRSGGILFFALTFGLSIGLLLLLQRLEKLPPLFHRHSNKESFSSVDSRSPETGVHVD